MVSNISKTFTGGEKRRARKAKKARQTQRKTAANRSRGGGAEDRGCEGRAVDPDRGTGAVDRLESVLAAAFRAGSAERAHLCREEAERVRHAVAAGAVAEEEYVSIKRMVKDAAASAAAAASAMPATPALFLAGACGATRWRLPAMLQFTGAGVPVYDPQHGRGEWHEGLVPIEADAKEKAPVTLFVIEETTSALASKVEIVQLAVGGAAVVLVLMTYRGTEVEKAEAGLTGEEYGEYVGSVNEARAALLRFVRGLPNVAVRDTLDDGVCASVDLYARALTGEKITRDAAAAAAAVPNGPAEHPPVTVEIGNAAVSTPLALVHAAIAACDRPAGQVVRYEGEFFTGKGVGGTESPLLVDIARALKYLGAGGCVRRP